MALVGEEQWLAVLREVRRQAKHVADAAGVESLLEGQGKLYDADEPSWEV